jgi:hypothetical protein
LTQRLVAEFTREIARHLRVADVVVRRGTARLANRDRLVTASRAAIRLRHPLRE